MSDYILIDGTLYHHGVLGQKWGKRNGLPYPLKEGKHSKAEEDAKKKFHLTDKQKKYAKIGLAILGTSLAVYGGYKIHKAGGLSKFIKKGRNSLNSSEDILNAPLKEFMDVDVNNIPITTDLRIQVDEWNENIKNSPFNSIDDIPKIDNSYFFDDSGKIYPDRLLENINPTRFSNDGTLGHDNCFKTVLAGVMRLKGYDVSSSEAGNANGWAPSLLPFLFENVKVKTSKNTNKEEIVSELLSQGNGAYGLLSIKNEGVGHAIMYYIEDKSVKFFDTQVNYIYKENEVYNLIDYTDYVSCRLDNCEPKDSIIGALTYNNKGETIIPFMNRRNK